MTDYTIFPYLFCFLMVLGDVVKDKNKDIRYGKGEESWNPSTNCSSLESDWENMFQCKDGSCIHKQKTCDWNYDCKNGEDESFIECGSSVCFENEFNCTKSQKCIAKSKQCDKVKDCENGEDEEDCESVQCSKIQFKCDNHFCVPRDSVCDFKDDCGDGSDEKNCESDYRRCWSLEFECDNRECIRPGQVCNGIKDCQDESDEIGCLPETCEDGRRIHGKYRCNGWPECTGNHADELNCPCNTASGQEFRCPNTRCLRTAKLCDGVCDCIGDCFDELNCTEFYTRADGYLKCLAGKTISCKSESMANHQTIIIERCIKPEFICDNVSDCHNGPKNISDEYGCPETMHDEMHNENYILCEGGTDLRRLPKSHVCDFQVDCLNGEDEADCVPKTCGPDESSCANGDCYPSILKCDSHPDCKDKSDETNCTQFKCPEGPPERKQCRNGQCIYKEYWCDFRKDCADGSDEDNCGPPRKCKEEEFQCRTLHQCIPKKHRCFDDGKSRSGCSDRSHLEGCANFTCPESTFKCKGGPCLDKSLECDGKIDCYDFWTDEENCEQECLQVCLCKDVMMNCSGLGLQELPKINELEDPIRNFYFANNNLSNVLNKDFLNLTRAPSVLDLSNNSICSIPPGIFKGMEKLKTFIFQNNCLTELLAGTFDGLSDLNGLHLEGNKIQKVHHKAFYGLSSLPTLNLKGQGIMEIHQGAFLGLRNLSSLDLSFNFLQHLPDGTFQGLNKLTYLNLKGNRLKIVGSQLYSIPTLRTLLFDEFRFCCPAGHLERCEPTSDEFSNCEDLMSNLVLRVCVWILGIIATLGNLLVIGWRLKYKHSNRVHSFLITNLAIGDLFMGCYLLVIASVDAHFRGVYAIRAEEWKNSKLCNTAGFLSTFSSELSVFTLTVITLDRFLVIIFPFRISRLEMHQTRWVMLGVWLLTIFLSALPLLYTDYFKNFYGRSGVCLALHITSEKQPGWEYSVFVFLFLNFISFSIIAVGYIWMYGVAKTTRLAVNRQAESKRAEQAMARRMTLIVATDAACWVPIIFLGILSLNDIHVPSQVFAWVAVFILPLNAAVNPILYTISTASFLDPATRNIRHFNRSFKCSLSNDPRTKRTYSSNLGSSFNNHSSYLHYLKPNYSTSEKNDFELVRMNASESPKDEVRKRVIRLHPCNSNWKRKNKQFRGNARHIQSLSNVDENEDSDYESEIFTEKPDSVTLKTDQDSCKWEFIANQIKNKPYNYSQHMGHRWCDSDSEPDLKNISDKRWKKEKHRDETEITCVDVSEVSQKKRSSDKKRRKKLDNDLYD